MFHRISLLFITIHLNLSGKTLNLLDIYDKSIAFAVNLRGCVKTTLAHPLLYYEKILCVMVLL